jgi:hypothetical protein
MDTQKTLSEEQRATILRHLTARLPADRRASASSVVRRLIRDIDGHPDASVDELYGLIRSYTTHPSSVVGRDRTQVDLETVRDVLLAAFVAAKPAEKAALAGQIRGVVKDLSGMTPAREATALDELRKRRADRSGAEVADGTGGKRRSGAGRSRTRAGRRSRT